MKRIIIERYPILSELISDQASLFQSILSTAFPFAFHITTKWVYGQYSETNRTIEKSDQLFVEIGIDCNLQNGIDSISDCICAFLSLNRYQFRTDDNSLTRINYRNSYILYERDSDVLPLQRPDQLFGILNYLKYANGCFICRIGIENQIVSCSIECHSIKDIEPWGIINGFELRPECYSGIAAQDVRIKNINTAIKLMSLPIAYDGIKNLLQGYDNRTKTPQELSNLAGQPSFPIVVGQINNRVQDEKLCMQPIDFSYMTAIWGVPGQGKSVLSISLIKQLWDRHIPSLIIEPSKHEYRALTNFFPQAVRIIKDMTKFNILEPPSGVNKIAWCEVIMTLLNMACQLPDDSSLSGYYRNAYLLMKEPLTPMRMLLTFDVIMEHEGFQGNQASDFVKAGRSRLQAFFTYFNGDNNKWEQPSEEFNKYYRSFNIENILSTPVIIELASITTPKVKSAWVYFILQHLYAHIQQRHSQSESLRNLLVIEEAHNILRKTSNEEVLNNVANILAEARALGLGVVISDQSPKSLDPSCTAMAQNVFSFKIVDKEDREIVANSTAGDAEKMLDIPKHNCLVRTNFMHEPDYIKVLSKYVDGISREANINNNLI